MFAHNSTIKVKQKICVRCGLPKYIFSKGRCVDCARIEDTMAKMESETEESTEREGLTELVNEADRVFSLWIRQKDINKNGEAQCFTCDTWKRWQEMQCGHYVKRGNLFLRWDERNCKVQCPFCNITKMGNYREYGLRLEALHPGLTEILYTEGNLVYKPSRDEIRAIITDYSLKLKSLKH